MNEFQSRGRFRLSSSRKFGVTSKAEIVIRRREFIECPVVDSLQLKRLNRGHFVAFGYQSGHQFARHVFVEENPHAAATSFSSASSCRAPRTASPVKVG